MAAVLSQRSPIIGPTMPGNEFLEDPYSTSTFLLSPSATNDDGDDDDDDDQRINNVVDDNNDEENVMDGNDDEKINHVSDDAGSNNDDDDDDASHYDKEEEEENDGGMKQEEDINKEGENTDADFSQATDKSADTSPARNNDEKSEKNPLNDATTTTTTINTKRRKRTQYKGLRNLGNTCYLNSALQMVFSLDEFMESLEEMKKRIDAAVLLRRLQEEKDQEKEKKQLEEEEVMEEEEKKIKEEQEDVPVMMDEEEENGGEYGTDLLFGFANDDDDDTAIADSTNDSSTANDQNNADKTASPYPLLDALLETFKDLSSEEESAVVATSPQKLKQILDEKTPLFIGYRQQDSHEFVSTLIDLLDEEIKKVMLEYQVGDVEEIIEEEDEKGEDKEEEDGMETDAVQDDDNESSQGIKQEEEEKDKEDDNEKESLRKKPKHSQNQSDFNVMKRASSLAELNLEAISDLLHGTPTTTTTTTNTANTPSLTRERSHSSPSLCKLAGGRMISSSSSSSSSSPLLPTVMGVDSSSSMSMTSSSSSHNHHHQQQAIMEEETIPEEEEEMENAVPIDYNVSNETSPIAAVDDKTESAEEETAALTEENETTTPEKKLQVKSTPLSTTFTAQIRNTLTCDSCCYSRSHIESYNHLSLEVVEEEGDCSSTIEEGLRKFLAEEKREIKCEKCFGESATQRMEIVKLPKALLLHLKRFIVDYTPCYTSATYRKNRSAVEFPQALSLCSSTSSSDDIAVDGDDISGVLGEFLAQDVTVPSTTEKQEQDDCNMDEMQDVDNEENDDEDDNDDDERENEEESNQRYKLRSVVHHIGSSASCGHYTADALRPYESKSGDTDDDDDDNSISSTFGTSLDWTRFNDSHVSIISEKDATGPSAQRTAYMVVYELE